MTTTDAITCLRCHSPLLEARDGSHVCAVCGLPPVKRTGTGQNQRSDLQQQNDRKWGHQTHAQLAKETPQKPLSTNWKYFGAEKKSS